MYFNVEKLRIALLLIPVVNFVCIHEMSMSGFNLQGFALDLVIGIGLLYLLFLGAISRYLAKSNFFSTRFFCHFYIILCWFILPVFLNIFLAWLNVTKFAGSIISW